MKYHVLNSNQDRIEKRQLRFHSHTIFCGIGFIAKMNQVVCRKIKMSCCHKKKAIEILCLMFCRSPSLVRAKSHKSKTSVEYILLLVCCSVVLYSRRPSFSSSIALFPSHFFHHSFIHSFNLHKIKTNNAFIK